MAGEARPLALIVEDEALLALLVEDLLTAEGFETVRAVSEASAATLIGSSRPFTVAVVNLQLGGDIAGQRIIGALRQRMPALPVVVVTGFGKDASQADLRGLGWPTVRLEKPDGYYELATAVWDVIDQARTGRQPQGGRRASDVLGTP
ncbi:response regulator [Paracraurococcus lichenis]|uniref:Response regulator n=1 Tax=Paracraurococcus lichenis TaxID=3064888 RepID=A0ABT9EED5_9PROT|nr:response regulator [Paracraurococcus sp. LOR1-02]MDO9714449.1 response regulator [Paracraurococcus sp. LOR1-02]